MNRKFLLAACLGALLAPMVFSWVLAVADEGTPQAPLGLPPIFWPDENPYTPAKAELGKLLFFDKRLSSDGSVACASCHDPAKAFADGAANSLGIGGQRGGRSAPTVINRAYSTLQFWDGRAPTLEEQAKGPIANPIEMTIDKATDLAHGNVVKRLKAVPGYAERFKKVFGTADVTIDQVAQAIATFERTVLSGNSPFDRYQAGDEKALTPAQRRGLDVFFKKAACDSCHIGFNFTDGSYENIGIGMDRPNPDLGRYLVTTARKKRARSRPPPSARSSTPAPTCTTAA